MKLEVVTWKITGIRPLMQSNYANVMPTDTATKTSARSTKAARDTPFNEAEKQLYNGGDHYWHPALAFWKGLMENCTGFKVGGVAASTLFPRLLLPLEQEEFILYDPATLDKKTPKKLTSKDWQMDTRRIVNEKAGALIVHRPKWQNWGGLLSMEADLEIFEGQAKKDAFLDCVTEILNVAGRFGIGTGRMMLNPKTKRWGGLNLGKFSAERK